MTQLEGFIKKGDENKVCLLKRSLYGLKQSPRQWYKRFDTFIMENGFKSYVMLIVCKSKVEIVKVKEMLKGEFKMKDIGPANKILGMEILRDRTKDILIVNQKSYIAKVLKKFNMEKSKPEYMKNVPYANAIENLMYVMI